MYGPVHDALMLCSAFFECADNKGIFEWNTVTNTFVKFFANITGYVSVAPGDDEVLVVGYDSNVNVLKPQGELRFLQNFHSHLALGRGPMYG